MRLDVGTTPPDFTKNDVYGNPVTLTELKGKKIFLAFLRNTRCPLCSRFLLGLSRRIQVFGEEKISMVIVYESRKELFLLSGFFKNLLEKHTNLRIISDPQRKLYDLYGAEISPEKSTLEALQEANRMVEIEDAVKEGFTGDAIEEGTHPDAIPADFFINEDFEIEYAHYGNDAGDHIAINLIEAFANGEPIAPAAV
ncbi:hypothetical protein BKI52_11315 [marine bacterium AO1-C]|nr:hypothetical protein BKI52_11315 [marine bacterium AO1-C]